MFSLIAHIGLAEADARDGTPIVTFCGKDNEIGERWWKPWFCKTCVEASIQHERTAVANFNELAEKYTDMRTRLHAIVAAADHANQVGYSDALNAFVVDCWGADVE